MNKNSFLKMEPLGSEPAFLLQERTSENKTRYDAKPIMTNTVFNYWKTKY